ncbi:MAG: hypothetical protein JOY54_04215 [Acidobacteriaceae bacterium]|nr:hypothetical protein [Acidobacteriaceae bacterium]
MAEQNIPTLMIVGGFLGAGKTTLILKAADLLRQRGKRVAVIMNDQDAGLVDTRLALARNVPVREIADGCFCCRFSAFMAAANELAGYRPDVILAEPVGSCVDLSATVMRPLRSMYGDKFRLAPLTVLLDPATANRFDSDDVDPDVRYLLIHQLAEADLVCTTKQDLYPEPVALPVPTDFHLSGLTGAGIQPWLDEMLQTTRVVGARLLDVDYERYAQAEAALGWLNLHARIRLGAERSPALLCGPLLENLEQALTSAEIRIAHLKIFDRTATGWLKASIVQNGAEPTPEGDLLAEPSDEHELAINLRAIADPGVLQQIVSEALAGIDASVEIQHMRAFRPAAPKPEYREV